MTLPDNSHFSKHLPDIQTTEDARGIMIDEVGISKVVLPVKFKRKSGTTQDTVASLTLTTSLPAKKKGTHMSRLTELLYQHKSCDLTFGADELPELAKKMLAHVCSDDPEATATIHLQGEYFFDVKSPLSDLPSIAPGMALLTIVASAEKIDMYVGLKIQGKTVCPCSREISDFDETTGTGKGAHAQRGDIIIRTLVAPGQFVWFEDLFEIAKNSFSSPVYPLLKRVDEREVTMGAYANPGFVEDVLRKACLQLDELLLSSVKRYTVEVENFESIHYHNAYAKTQRSGSSITKQDEISSLLEKLSDLLESANPKVKRIVEDLQIKLGTISSNG